MLSGSARGNEKPGPEALSISALAKRYPGIRKVLAELGVPLRNAGDSSLAFLCEEAGVDPRDVFDILSSGTKAPVPAPSAIESITIVPGRDKSGKPEHREAIPIASGEIVAIVGPTGSGKSRLLADIEGLVQADSPSGRAIRINDAVPDDEMRTCQTGKPIAQISQGMNYLLDLTIDEFLDLHIESRAVPGERKLKTRVLREACSLCGEPFTLKSPMVSLSGGQARALMIADAVHVSAAPIILVDEIENAGIDRVKAVELLLAGRAITIIATHDPLIALLAHKRIVLKNGGMARIIKRSAAEEETVAALKKIGRYTDDLKEKLRGGDEVASGMKPS